MVIWRYWPWLDTARRQTNGTVGSTIVGRVVVSYDLQVYAPRGFSAAELRALVFDAGLGVDDDEPDESLTVVRGARRGSSFTLALPVPVQVEDVPEQVTAVLLDAAY